MSTLSRFGLWQKAQEPTQSRVNPGSGEKIQGSGMTKPAETLAQSRVSTQTRVFEPKSLHVHDTHAHNTRVTASRTLDYFTLDTLDTLDWTSNGAGLNDPGSAATLDTLDLLGEQLSEAGAAIDDSQQGEPPTVVVPAGIPSELVHRVERLGWRVIPGDKPGGKV